MRSPEALGLSVVGVGVVVVGAVAVDDVDVAVGSACGMCCC